MGTSFARYFPVQVEADFGLTQGLLKENGRARLEFEQASAAFGKQAARTHVLKQSLLFSASSSSRLSMRKTNAFSAKKAACIDEIKSDFCKTAVTDCQITCACIILCPRIKLETSLTSLHNSNITVANAGPSQLCFLFRPSSVHRQCLTHDRQWVTGSY